MEALYVPDIVDETATSFFDVDQPDGKILIIMGSAGDGKTAIFGRSYRQSTQLWFKSKHLNLDATATTKFGETEADQLGSFLESATTDLGVSGQPRRGLAINLGIALNFFAEPSAQEKYNEIWDAIQAARKPSNFEESCLYRSENVIVANLSHRRLFNTHPYQLGTGLLQDLVGKFDYTNDETEAVRSPFAEISGDIEDRVEDNPIAYNLKWLANSDVQNSLIRILAGRAILSNQHLNPRRILHYLSHILIPPALAEYVDAGTVPQFETLAEDDVPIAESLLWNSTYEVLTRPAAETVQLDPCAVFDLRLDERVLSLTNAQSETVPEVDIELDRNGDSITNARTRIRMEHLRNESEVQTEERTQTFRQFTAARATLDDLWMPDKDGGTKPNELQDKAGELTDETYELVVEAIQRWSQHSEPGSLVTIADGKESTKYRFLSEWDRKKAKLNKEKSAAETTEETQLGKIWFVFKNGVKIPLPYELYRLLSLIADGYNPDAVDPKESEGVRLIHSQLSRFTNKQEELEVHDAGGQVALRVQHKTGWEDGIQVEK